MCAQVSNAHGWHGARKKARANEQQKQQQPQKLKQKLKQKQDKKQKQKQKLKLKQNQEQEQEQNGGGETGALVADGIEARMSQPLVHTCTASSGIAVCWLFSAHAAGPLCVGHAVGRVGEGHGRCHCA